MDRRVEYSYYKIVLTYEIPYNVLSSTDPEIAQARQNLYKRIEELAPKDNFEHFSTKVNVCQLKDTYNYIINYESFFRSVSGLPMENYTEADEIKKNVMREIEAFLNYIDCDYKRITIKTLL